MNFLTVYRASAGSGKTFTLAAEYIARLLQASVSMHRAILAVTFTNKATAEMKERILQNLYDIAAGDGGDFAEAVAERLPGLDGETLQARARDALTAVVHDYDHFHVMTIDRFFQRMLTALAHELGLSASYRVDVNDEEVAAAAVDDMLLGLAETRSPALLHIVGDYIQGAMEDGEGWRIADKIKAFASRNALSDVFQADKEEYAWLLGNVQSAEDFRRKVVTLLRSTDDECDMHREITATARALHGKLLDMNDAKQFDKGKLMEKYLARVACGNFAAPSENTQGYLDAPETFVHEKFASDPAVRDMACSFIGEARRLQHDIDALTYRRNSALLTLQTFNDLRLLGEISRHIDVINAEHNRFLLSRTKWLFSQMVKASDTPFVFEKIGTRLQHIMIDEFQDTARTQWENIRKLLLENISRGETCLIVGDVKQSIYRFNGGDWGILENIGDEVGVPLDSKPLRVNFRSLKRIVGFNNHFFTAAAENMDLLGDTEIFTKLYKKDDTEQLCKNSNDTGFVRCTVYQDKKCNALCEESDAADAPVSLYGWICRLHNGGIPYSDMAILVRWNREAEKIVDHFSRLHPEIPLVSQEAFLLSASPAVMTVISALRWLADGTDTVSLAYCADIYQNRIMLRDIDTTDIAQDRGQYAPEELINERTALRVMPLYEAALRICQIFGFNELDETPTMQGQGIFLGCFFDEILSFVDDGDGDLRAFLRYWDEKLNSKKIPTAETDGISIVTIHKSKGLAYDTVLIPFCDWDIEKPHISTNSYIWARGSDAPYDTLPHYPVKEKKDIRMSTYSADYVEELKQRRVDSVNMLYVAFTRAKSNLLFWSSAMGKSKVVDGSFTIGNLVRHTVESLLNEKDRDRLPLRVENCEEAKCLTYTHGEPFCKALEQKKNDDKEEKTRNPLKYDCSPLPLTIKTSKARFRFMQSSEAAQFIKADEDEENRTEEYIKRGNLLHRLFSMIRYKDEIDGAILQAKNEGLLKAEDENSIYKFIQSRINGTTAGEWFSRKWTVHNECEILSPRTGMPLIKRPDRVMTHGKDAIVVDYKFGKPNTDYREQVREYMKLLGELGYDNVQGYIWYMYSDQIENA